MRRLFKHTALALGLFSAISWGMSDAWAQGKGGGDKGGGGRQGGGGGGGGGRPSGGGGGGGAPFSGGGNANVRAPSGNPGGGNVRVQGGGNANVRAPSISQPAPRVNPPQAQPRQPAVVARPPAVNVNPGANVRPPAVNVNPGANVRPPAVTANPPGANVRPPAVNVNPPGANVRPPAVTANPPGANVRPPAVTATPPAVNVRPPAVNVNPPGANVQPPNVATRPRDPNATIDGRVGVDGRVDGRVGVDGRNPGRPAFDPTRDRIDPRTGARIDGRVDGRVDGRNDGRIDGRVDARTGVRTDGRRVDADISANIRNRTFTGNTINLSNNRSIQFANQNYRPSYYRHPSFYRGYWNANRNFGGGSPYGAGYRGNYFGPYYGYGTGWGYGGGNNGIGMTLAQLGLSALTGGQLGGGYGYSPVGWGMGGWGLGSLGYNSGYLAYNNPYYSNAGPVVAYNYAQPIPVSYAVATDTTTTAASANDVLNAAVVAFQANDFDKALDIVDKGIQQYPDDSVLHEFRSLTLFARQDYQQSAATIHSVLAVGPGWNWTTMSGLYGDINQYTNQLRALEAYAKQNPQDAPSRFLLSYHYMVGGHNDAAARQLDQVVKLKPNDRVAADLLRMVQPQQTFAQTDATPPAPAAEVAQPVAVDASKLVGNWTAARDGGAKFNLVLDNNSQFKWVFSQDNKPATEFQGKYTMEGNVIALERQDGGSLIAQVTPDASGNFNFKLVGAPSDDPGLTFTR